MTTIAQLNGKWYVVKSGGTHLGVEVWIKVSEGFSTSYEARAYQLEIVMGRV